jgi:hypothetical protein
MAAEIYLQHRKAYGGEDIQVIIYDSDLTVLDTPIYWKIVPDVAAGTIEDRTFFVAGSGAGWLNGGAATSLEDFGGSGVKYSGTGLPTVITQTSPYLETPTPDLYASFLLKIPTEAGVSPWRRFKIEYYGEDSTYTTVKSTSANVDLFDESLTATYGITADKINVIEGESVNFTITTNNFSNPANGNVTYPNLRIIWQGIGTYNGNSSWRPRGNQGSNGILVFNDNTSWTSVIPITDDSETDDSATFRKPIVKDTIVGNKQFRAAVIDTSRNFFTDTINVTPTSLDYARSFYLTSVATGGTVTVFDSAVTLEITTSEIFEGEGVSVLASLDRILTTPANYTVYWRIEQISGTVTGSTFTTPEMTGSFQLRTAGEYTDQILSKTTVVEDGFQEKSFKVKIYYDQAYTDLAGETETITIRDSSTRPISSSDPFYVSGGISVGSPPKTIIDGAGNILGKNISATDNLIVNGDYTALNSEVFIEDEKITLNAAESANDFTARNGGIVLRGDTDKTLLWTVDNGSSSWTSNQDFNLITGKEYRINDTKVIDSTSLGSGVVTSSLTSVGTIGTGVWQGTIISPTYGGTGINNSTKTITLGGNLTTSGAFASTFTMTGATTVTFPTTGRLVGTNDTDIVTNAMLVNDGITVNGSEVKLGGTVTTLDNDTTYSISAAAGTGGARIDLVAGGSGSGTDSITLVGGTNVTVTRTNADTITISSQDDDTKYSLSAETATGGVDLRLTGTDTTTDNVRFANGSNVTITRTDGSTVTISATDTTYTAGTGITLTGTSFSIPQAVATNSTVTFSAMNLGTATGAAAGQLRASDDIIAFASSDITLKENISLISNSLEKVKRLRGVAYDWTDSYIQRKGGLDDVYMRRRDIGLLAQDVEQVLPEIVARRQDGYLAIKYDRVVALLVEAIKDLSEQVERLKKDAT